AVGSSPGLLPSWDPSRPTPYSWQGVVCSPQSRVISLSLPNTFLNLTTIPPELSSLTSLQFLNLSSANISGSIPPSLGALSSLRLLDLSYNALSGPIPPQLGAITLLGFLLLNSNRLSGSIPAALANLTSLQVLCLQDNLLTARLSALPPAVPYRRQPLPHWPAPAAARPADQPHHLRRRRHWPLWRNPSGVWQPGEPPDLGSQQHRHLRAGAAGVGLLLGVDEPLPAHEQDHRHDPP
ncbi:unnamed protein product, partial [Musa banksii]